MQRQAIYDTLIIGAGTAGCALAQQLKQAGEKVLLIEKSRGLGGRCSRRQVEIAAEGKSQAFSLDLGAMAIDPAAPSSAYPEAAELLQVLQQQGLLHPWQVQQASFAQPQALQSKTYLSAAGNLNRLHKHWAQDIDAARLQRVTNCRRQSGLWYASNDKQQTIARAKKLVCTAPPQQCLDLLDWPLAWQGEIQTAQQACQPQWVAALALNVETAKRRLEAEVYQGGSAVLQRAHCESAKPQRQAQQVIWVLQSQYDWARDHVQIEAEQAGRLLVSEFCRLFDLDSSQARLLTTHRWLLARNDNSYKSANSLWSQELGLGIAADWLASGDIGGAMLSGLNLFSKMNNA